MRQKQDGNFSCLNYCSLFSMVHSRSKSEKISRLRLHEINDNFEQEIHLWGIIKNRGMVPALIKEITFQNRHNEYETIAKQSEFYFIITEISSQRSRKSGFFKFYSLEQTEFKSEIKNRSQKKKPERLGKIYSWSV